VDECRPLLKGLRSQLDKYGGQGVAEGGRTAEGGFGAGDGLDVGVVDRCVVIVLSVPGQFFRASGVVSPRVHAFFLWDVSSGAKVPEKARP